MVAATYGVGRDDYLAVVLAYIPGSIPECDQFVTWSANLDRDGSEPSDMGEGHYMSRGEAKPGSAAEREWINTAWDAYEKRSRGLYQRTPEWFRWMASQKASA